MDTEIVKNIIQIPSNMIKNNEQYYILYNIWNHASADKVH